MLTRILRQLYHFWLRSAVFPPIHRLERALTATCIRSAVVRHNRAVVIDVGANTGQFARLLRHIGYHGWIVSFEPVPHVFDILSANLRGDSRWLGFQLALGDADGSVTINVGTESDLSSVLPAISAHWYAGATVAKLARLDTIWHDVLTAINLNRTAKVFLKLDTQGYDIRVLTGAATALAQTELLLTELSCVPLYVGAPLMNEALRVYTDAGFLPVHFAPVVRNREHIPLEFDCLMVRREMKNRSSQLDDTSKTNADPVC